MMEHERKKIKLSIWGVIGIFILYMSYSFSITLLGTLLLKMFGLNYEHPIFLISCKILTFIFVVTSINKNHILSIKSNLNVEKRYIKLIIPVAMVSFGLFIINYRLVDYIVELFPLSDFLKEAFESASKTPIVWDIIIGAIIAPITEEILMRGIILDGLLRRYSNKTAILIGAFLFGAMHLNIYQFVTAFLGALLIGWIYVRTKSLFLCIIAHVANNLTMNIARDLLNLKIPGFTIEGIMPLWFLALGVALLIAGVLLMKKICDRDSDVNDGIVQEE